MDEVLIGDLLCPVPCLASLRLSSRQVESIPPTWLDSCRWWACIGELGCELLATGALASDLLFQTHCRYDLLLLISSFSGTCVAQILLVHVLLHLVMGCFII